MNIDNTKLYTFKEMESFVKQLKQQIESSTIDPKTMIDYYNGAKVIKILNKTRNVK